MSLRHGDRGEAEVDAASSPRSDAPRGSSSGPGTRWQPRITGRGGRAACRRSARTPDAGPARSSLRSFRAEAGPRELAALLCAARIHQEVGIGQPNG